MNLSTRILLPALFAAAILPGCGKKETPNTTSDATSAPTPAPAPANPSPITAATASTFGAESTAKLSDPQRTEKLNKIKNDPEGQWAIEATASSSYKDAQGAAPWSPNQATGAPDFDKYADEGKVWTPKRPDSGLEWLDLKFANPVHAEQVRIRESFGAGAVVKVEVFDEQNTAHAVWTGKDPTSGINFLIVKFPKTRFKTQRVKITLDTNVIPGWNEIDAVQLVGAQQ